jgi:hypothetical protein
LGLKINLYSILLERELSYTASGQTIIKVQLLNLNGRVMHQVNNPEANGCSPDTESLSAWVYFLRFEKQQGYRGMKVMRQ